MNIITCNQNHLSLIAPLFDAYRQFYGQASDLSGAQKFLRERLDRKESVVFLAMNEPGEALGFTQLYPVFSSVSMTRVWLLNDLFVAASVRKLGIGESLLNRARTFAAEAGAKGIQLETGTTNLEAQRLYEKLGYMKNEKSFFYFLRL